MDHPQRLEPKLLRCSHAQAMLFLQVHLLGHQKQIKLRLWPQGECHTTINADTASGWFRKSVWKPVQHPFAAYPVADSLPGLLPLPLSLSLFPFAYSADADPSLMVNVCFLGERERGLRSEGTSLRRRATSSSAIRTMKASELSTALFSITRRGLHPFRGMSGSAGQLFSRHIREACSDERLAILDSFIASESSNDNALKC